MACVQRLAEGGIWEIHRLDCRNLSDSFSHRQHVFMMASAASPAASVSGGGLFR